MNIGFGTYPLKDEICVKAVSEAIEAGYRLIDSATFYENLKAVGQAIKPFERKDLYIISKVWPDSQTAKGVRADLKAALKDLQTPYLDGYLIHWPNSQIPIEETLNAMNELRLQGLVRDIGVSNFTVNHLKRVLPLNIPIHWLQVEMHPHFYDPQVIEFAQSQGIHCQAWSPLGRGGINDDPLLRALAKKYGKTVPQVALRWITQHNCMPLPGSKDKTHMRQNLEIFDFTLSDEEMEKINAQAKSGERKRISFDEFDFTFEQCWGKNH